LSKHAAYTPRHRGPAQRPVVEGSKRAARKFFVLSAVAVAGTGVAVGGGVAMHHHAAQVTEAADLTPVAIPVSSSQQPAAAPQPAAARQPSVLADRRESLSRSDNRARLDPVKAASLEAVAGSDHSAITKTEDLAAADPQTIASAMMAKYGWDGSQFSCLVSLWNRESGWNVHADNASSGAYGIPQSLPGSKMASAGPDWQNNPETQIAWGLGYISERYGSPCGAWGHSQATGWY